ncbi:GNAT family N-acetyltransferase [Amnibacterium kyonggiense]|uniref:RimJ/RimL family protein N-acetyltransferase n=1 Tax=Amnibacterium kyonggiense TaxID=595671 RepID=A0A4R7FPA0_9MICO|nr:GNAT family protein [Amnibacterium kyonggiense]TDS79567.1 RimJ/RimL family protein N-acetyltransferase [Amnibacterium kyonggiense]
MLAPALLVGEHVRLEPLGPQHVAGLARAAADGDVWRKWTTWVPSPEGMAADVEQRLADHAAGRMVPWATCLPDGTPVGETTYWEVDTANRRVEIGATWLGRSAQGTAINPEAKLLQLTRAFDELECIAVEFRTHWHNRQSRRAIAALGAKQDGVLRNHRVMPDGSLRDTVVFSIVRDEWPAARSGLRARLGRA